MPISCSLSANFLPSQKLFTSASGRLQIAATEQPGDDSRPCLDQLEPRLLLSVVASFNSATGKLSIQYAGADEVTVCAENANVKVKGDDPGAKF